MMGSCSWRPQVYLFKSKKKPKSPQHLQSMTKPQSKRKQHRSHSGLKTGSSRKGGAPPRTLSAHRTRLGSLHSYISKCTEEKRKRNGVLVWEEQPQAVPKPSVLKESPRVPRLAVSGEGESSPTAALNHEVRDGLSGYVMS